MDTKLHSEQTSAMADLASRDSELEEMWEALGDISMDPITERLEEDFLCFKAGTDRETVWHWFDQRYSKGVAYLLYGGKEDFVELSKEMYGLKKQCASCDVHSCPYAYRGECRFALVHERKPMFDSNGSCLEHIYHRK